MKIHATMATNDNVLGVTITAYRQVASNLNGRVTDIQGSYPLKYKHQSQQSLRFNKKTCNFLH